MSVRPRLPIWSETYICRTCSTSVDPKQMRRHEGVHILKEKVENVCGFCSVGGCSIDLIVASGRGKTLTMTDGSNSSTAKSFH